MLSIETARKLRDAGWFTKFLKGGWYYDYSEHARQWLDLKTAPITTMSWVIPRLDQLLAEIEKRGWGFDLFNDNGKYGVAIIKVVDGVETIKEFDADSPAEAAAQALLWILQEGK